MPARDNKPAKDKLVLSFEGQKKSLVLNSTNYNYLRAEICRDPGLWVGAVLGIYTEPTTFGGKPTRGVRLKVLQSPAGVKKPNGGDAPTTDSTMDSEIPF
jgi:hypothetical protein